MVHFLQDHEGQVMGQDLNLDHSAFFPDALGLNSSVLRIIKSKCFINVTGGGRGRN